MVRIDVIAGIFACVLSFGPCVAFDNIEADAAYERAIRDRIQKEFVAGLALLKDQALRLQMQPREKDIDALRRHMYEKALLLGGCYDQAITIKKHGEKVEVPKFASRCEDEHLKFVGEVRKGNYSEHVRTMCALQSRARTENKPYDFLFIGESDFGIWGPSDLLLLKKCYESPPHGLR